MSYHVVVFALLCSFSARAELIMIRTINGVNLVLKESILEGPDGYLKSLLINEEIMGTSSQPDGSFFVNVDNESMKYVLSYIRHGKVSWRKIHSSLALKNDFNFLLPGVLPAPKVKPKKIWECAAYCDYEREKSTMYMSTSNYSLIESWRNLIDLCKQKGTQTYLLIQPIYKQYEYIHALASMKDACVLKRQQ